MNDVLIVGAGPTGLTAAIEAVRHGLSVRIVDASPQPSIHSKALVLHARSLEVFAHLGCAETLIQSGQEFKALHIHSGSTHTRIDFSALEWGDAAYPYWLSLPQSDTERLLEAHLSKLGVQVERSTQLTALTQDAQRVQATLQKLEPSGAVSRPLSLEAAWLVGADGARSTVRKLCNIGYEGSSEDAVFILADVRLQWDMPPAEGHGFLSPEGILLVVPMPQPQRYRLIAHLPRTQLGQQPELTLSMLQTLVDRRTNLSAKLSEVQWTSSFTVKHRVASQHRQGRVFLAGDAAHIHSPVGGQGLNTGIQDAYNLMWKLALYQQGHGSEALLHSYALERHAVAQALIQRVGLATKAVTLTQPVLRTVRNQIFPRLLGLPRLRNQMGRGVGMLDIHYRRSPAVQEDWNPKAPGLPRAGDRAPHVLFTDHQGQPHTLLQHLHPTRHTLLLFTGPDSTAPSPNLLQIQSLVAERYPQLIHTHLVSPSPLPNQPSLVSSDGSLHRRYGANPEALYLIRPDQHIAYCAQPVDPAKFMAYLEQFFRASQPAPVGVPA